MRELGFRRSPPDFHCLVAEENGRLIGLLVYYFVAFIYRAKPNIVVKELYIADGHRSKGAGKHEQLGAKIDPDWHEFQMSEEALRKTGGIVER